MRKINRICLGAAAVIAAAVLISCQKRSDIDRIYDYAGNPDTITSIVMVDSKGNDRTTITDPAIIKSFCEAVSSTTFDVSKTNDATAPRFVSFEIFHESNDNWYTLSVPNGRMIRGGLGKEIISPFYTITDYSAIQQWIEDNFGTD